MAAPIFVSVLPGQEAGDRNQKTINNVQKLEKIEEAMRSFMAFNGRRPCPADGQYAVGTANFGKEAATPGTCTGSTPAAPLGPDAGTGYIVGGVIPVTSLGLDESYAYDDFGRQFTYVVDKRATLTSSCLSLENVSLTSGLPTGTGGLKIESSTGGTVIDNTMYAYISHGASGYGAYPAQGAPTPAGRICCSTDADMQTNAGVDAVGAASTFTYNTTNFTNVKVQKDRFASNIPSGGTDSGFDDLVWYRPDLKNTCCLGHAACFSNGIRIDGVLANGDLGVATAFADINGDGIPDLILMAQDTTNGWLDLYVIFGQANRSKFPNPFLVSSLNGTNGFILTDIGTGSVPTNVYPNITVGDVNGDGIADIVVSWSGTNCTGGGVSIIFGQSGGTWPSTPTDIHTLTNSTSPQVTSLNDGIDEFGPNNLACAAVQIADVNHDGINDVIVGVGQNTAAYVFFGHPTQAALTANTYPNGPPTIWPSIMENTNLTGGTAAGTASAFVQEATHSVTVAATTNQVTFSSNTNAGDLIMVAIDYPSAATFPATPVTDSQSDTFTLVATQGATTGGKKTRVYYAKNITGGTDTVTLTFSASETSDIYVTEYAGLSTASPLDVQKGTKGNSSGAASSGSATTTVAGDLIYGFCFADSSGGCTAGSGFTARSGAGNLVEDMAAGAAGSYAATGTAGNSWTMQMVALEPASPPSMGFTIAVPNLVGLGGIGDPNGDGIKDMLFRSRFKTQAGFL